MNKKCNVKFSLNILSVIVLFFSFTSLLQATPPNTYIVPLSRAFSKDIFDLNAQPYLAPTVQAVNATSNAGFFHSAYVPRKVDKPYFRLTINGMLGFINDANKTFAPQIPNQKFDISKLSKYAKIDDIINLKFTITDTAGLINYLFQTLMYDGIQNKSIVLPETVPTALGSKTPGTLELPHDVMQKLVDSHALIKLLPKNSPETKAFIDSIIKTLPTSFTLTQGGNINKIIAGIPQLEVGSLYGTELLVRLIPPVDLGEWVGKFYFWGIGVKHSISQYFYKDTNRDGNANKREQIAPFDLSVQAVFQRTQLDNTVGVTDAKLNATANIMNFNIHFSKNFNNIIEIYSGVNFERTNINGTYTYKLPIQMQVQLGLAKPDPNDKFAPGIIEPPEFPGDTEPQSSDVNVDENHFKWAVGACRNIGPITLYVDYSISKFNVFNAGILYRF